MFARGLFREVWFLREVGLRGLWLLSIESPMSRVLWWDSRGNVCL